METRQPFFKPLDTQATRQDEKASRGAPFFAPLNQQTRMQCHELSQQGEHCKEKMASQNVKMSSLHAKLYQEADKIRKWKTHTEIEITQKDKKLLEASTTIGNLRKSILDVQLQNENLSMKYQEQLTNRDEILQKINATRDMCNLLKGYSAKVEERLEGCEGERTELKQFEKAQTQKFEDLSKKFKSLEITAAQKHNNLLNQVKAEQEEKREMKENYEHKINDTNGKLDNLSRQCHLKEECITSVTADMKLIEEKLGILRVEHAFLQEQFQQLETQHTELNSKYSTKSEDLDNSMEMIAGLEQVVNESSIKLQQMASAKDHLERHLTEMETGYTTKLKNLKADYDGLKEWAETEGKRLKNVESALCQCEQSLEETKCTKDMLLLERSEMQSTLKQCNEHETNLTITIAEKEEHLSQLTMDISGKNSQIEQMLLNKKELEEETERLKEDLQESLQNEKSAYEMVDDIKLKLENKSDESRSTSDKLKVIQSDNKSHQKKTNALEKEIKLLKENLEKSQVKESKADDKVKELELSLETTREELKKIEEEHNITSTRLEEEASNATDFKNNAERKENEIQTLEEKMKTMKADITAKNKQIKELEKESRSLKSKFTAKEKADLKFGEAHNQLRDRLTTLTEDADNLQAKLEVQLQKNEEHEQKIKDLQEQAKESDKERKTQKKEQEASKKLHDAEMSKMVSLLEEYKIMNERTVEDKQKEIESILKKSKAQENEQRDQVKKIHSETEKVKEIEKTLSVRENELAEVKETCSKQKQQIEDLEDETKSLKKDQKNLTKQEKDLAKMKETCAKQKEQIKDLEKVTKELKGKDKTLLQLEKKLQESEENSAQQKEQIKDLEKVTEELKGKDKTLLQLEKKLQESEQNSAQQAEDMLKLKKELEDIEELKQRESEVEKLRKEVEQLKVASAKTAQTSQATSSNEAMTNTKKAVPDKPSKVPIVKKDKPMKEKVGKENRPNKEASRVKNVREATPSIQRTPKIPTPKSPAVSAGLVTPVQTGIRHFGESVVKRRKVMFSDLPPEDKLEETADSDSDVSSSSELMEFDTSHLKLQSRFGTGKVQTPVIFKPSPRVKASHADSVTKKSLKMTPVPRAPAIEKKAPVPKDSTNMRRTPAGKTGNRFFTASPGVRKGMTMGRKAKPVEELAWFDNDAVFGFDNED